MARRTSISSGRGLALGVALSTLCAGAAAAVQQAAPGTAELEGTLTAESLLDGAIQSADGEVVGEIRQLLLDPVQGSIRRVVVDLIEPERRTIAVPWSYLDVRPNGSISWRVSEEELLRSPSYPSGGPSSGAEAPAAADEGLTTYAPAAEAVDRFDPSGVLTYRGAVVGTMTAPLQGNVDDVVALIDAGEGEQIIAHLGPEFYLTQIGLDLTPGQAVVAEGSPSRADDRIVLVVSKITVQGRPFVLRNLDGTPLWSRPNFEPRRDELETSTELTVDRLQRPGW